MENGALKGLKIIDRQESLQATLYNDSGRFGLRILLR